MKDFLKIKFQSRTDLVVDKITNSIINGELSDGELLPPENQLCKIFGVSRSILREAIRALVSKGLVEVKQGYGTFVRLPKIEVPEEAVRNYLMTNKFSLQQLMEIRTPIEVEVARLAAQRREEKHLNIMERSLQIMRNESSSVEVYIDADETFHKAIIDASNNPLFGIMIRSIMGNLHISRQLVTRHFGVGATNQEHTSIFEAIKNKQPSAAAIKMKEHMEGFLSRISQLNILLKKEKSLHGEE
ncbi:MAG: FadR family transcriptional regulator [Syntrophaceae bacterium]|nr:FadR family transcriptional regulator [Syntrophaceae bacterium]